MEQDLGGEEVGGWDEEGWEEDEEGREEKAAAGGARAALVHVRCRCDRECRRL